MEIDNYNLNENIKKIKEAFKTGAPLPKLTERDLEVVVHNAYGVWTVRVNLIKEDILAGGESDDDYDEDGDDYDDYDEDGYDRDGYNYFVYDRDGYNRDGYSRNDFNSDGLNRDGGRYINGYDRDGHDRDGYSQDGWNQYLYDRDGYDMLGYNRDGYDRDGDHENRESKEFKMWLVNEEKILATVDRRIGECVICSVNPINVILINGDYGHSCVCSICARTLKYIYHNCPMCREEIRAVCKIYFDQ